MSEMPERIWAGFDYPVGYGSESFDSKLCMWDIGKTRGDTEYIRADIVAGQLMRCHAFYKEQAETCRALIKEALPLWDWDDPEHDPFTAHPFEQNVRTALRYQASEINRLANAQQNIIAEKDAEIERLRKVVEQAAEIVVRLGRDIYPDVTNQRYTCFDEWDDDNQCWGCGYTESPELAAYLREREGKEEAI